MNDDLGILLLRVIIGALILGHGVQKVSYRLGGEGLQGGIAEFRADGFRGGAFTALAAGLGQIGSGAFVILGLLTPAAAMTTIGIMTVAITVKAPNGLWVQHDGYEFPLVLVTIAAALGFTGPGRYSLDALLGLDEPALWVGAAALVLGVAAGLGMRAILHTGNPDTPTPTGARPRP